jgi:predicted small lipoprotein YifL
MVRDFIASFRKVSLVLVAAAICVASLAACGVKGPLKPVPPSAPTAGALPSEPPATPAQQPPPERKP